MDICFGFFKSNPDWIEEGEQGDGGCELKPTCTSLLFLYTSFRVCFCSANLVRC